MSTGNHILSGIKNKRKLSRPLWQGWKRIEGSLLADNIMYFAVLFYLVPHSPHQGISLAGLS